MLKFISKKRRDVSSMPERKILQKVISEILKEKVKTLNSELQTILIEDMITVFYNRLNIMKEISQYRERQLSTNNFLVLEHGQILDPDSLQSMDENNKKWVKDWKKEAAKLT